MSIILDTNSISLVTFKNQLSVFINKQQMKGILKTSVILYSRILQDIQYNR